jgi:hypothetical protein
MAPVDGAEYRSCRCWNGSGLFPFPTFPGEHLPGHQAELINNSGRCSFAITKGFLFL